jgi:hypothetical protein
MYLFSSFYIPQVLISISSSTPLYQFLDHALADPSNRTKFTLIYANLSPSDILLREELDALQKNHPKTFDIVYVVDKPVQGWSGPTGYINKDLIKKHVPSKDLGEKVKIFICGKPNVWTRLLLKLIVKIRPSCSGCIRCWPESGHEAGPAWWYSQGARLHRGAGNRDINFQRSRITDLDIFASGLQILIDTIESMSRKSEKYHLFVSEPFLLVTRNRRISIICHKHGTPQCRQ